MWYSLRDGKDMKESHYIQEDNLYKPNGHEGCESVASGGQTKINRY